MTLRESLPQSGPATTPPAGGAAGARALALLRVATGLVFLWAFVDKTFGLGYATPGERAWIVGGSPTAGFLGSVDAGPFRSAFQAVAGAWWVDGLFMLDLLGIGVAVTAGVALRISAVAGTVMMALMWLAEWPLARFAADGSPSGSTNPLIEYHVIYALVLVVLAATYAGDTWGLGRWWAGLSFVRRHAWAR